MHGKTILHIDMNSFFASVEQQANPFIRNKPVACAHTGYSGAAVLAASYEAKAFGVKTGTRVFEARKMCPGILIVPMDTTKYYAVNRQFIKIFEDYTPKVEVYSIDEAFLDVTDSQHLFGGALAIAMDIKRRLKEEIGECIRCSVGIGVNKLVAKIGSNFKKPEGLTVIPWESRFEFLDQMKLTDVWGIGYRVGGKMAKFGIRTLGEIRKMSDSDLRSLIGGYYTRLKLIANGEHFEDVKPNAHKKPPKSMQHAHTLSDATSDRVELLSLIRKQAERLGRRLRRKGMKTRNVNLGLVQAGLKHYGWGADSGNFDHLELDHYTDDGYEIYKAGETLFDDAILRFSKDEHGKMDPIRLVVLGVADLLNSDNLEFSFDRHEKREGINEAFDEINSRYGEFTLRSGDILYQYAKEKELDVEREQMTFHPGL